MGSEPKSAAEWLEAAVAGAHIAVSGMARNEAIACAAAAADLGVALAMLRDAKAELERLSIECCAYCGAYSDVAPPHVHVRQPRGWSVIEAKFARGEYE